MYIRMNGKNINFGDKKNNKKWLLQIKRKVTSIDVDANKILVFKNEPYGTKKALKCVIGYNNNDVIRPLCLRLPQITGYAKKFNENATMSFRVNNKQLLKNYKKIWEKVKKLLKINFERKAVYGDDDKYIKTKINIYASSMNTNFDNKKIY